jgi:hypothetical protein
MTVAATTATAVVTTPITVSHVTAATSGVTRRGSPTGVPYRSDRRGRLVLAGTSVINAPSSWPVGSVWFDPAAQVAAATTVQGTAELRYDKPPAVDRVRPLSGLTR